MTPAAIKRRLSEIEAQVAALAPPPSGAAPAWLSWTTDAELDELDRLASREAFHGVPLSNAEQLRVIAIEAGALARIAAGEPTQIEQSYRVMC